MEREAFLERARRAAAAATVPSAPGSDPGLLEPDLPEVDLVEHFSAVLASIDGEAHQGDPLDLVAEIAERYDALSFVSWDPDQLPVPGVIEHLQHLGLVRHSHDVPADPVGRIDTQMGYLDLVLGITGAEAAFAESGTVVLRSGPGRPRMASLVPLVHVVLLEQARLHRSLSHWAAGGIGDDAANLIFISGPSRTGDIEQHLNLGVHGPKHLHVVLV